MGIEIAIFSDDPDVLLQLRRKRPDVRFIDGVRRSLKGAQLAIVDRVEPAFQPVLSSDVVVLTLTSGGEDASGSHAVDRARFLEDPEPALSLAIRLAVEGERARMLRHLEELLDVDDLPRLAQLVTRTLGSIIDSPSGTMLMNDARGSGFVTMFSDDPEHTEGGSYVPGVTTDLLRRGLTAVEGYAVELPRSNLDGMAIFPIQIEHDLIGVVKVPLPAEQEFDPELAKKGTEYIRTITPVLRQAYQLDRTRELALMDDLTRCYNRRFFEAYLDDEMERARRHKSVLSIVFMDLDDLKTVNNTYGHLAGSRVLQEVGRRIISAVRTIDKVVRFGGDEFCIILPQTGQEQATAVASRIRDAISLDPCFVETDANVSITASFGIASYPLHAISKEDLVSAADAAMLLVKSTTKNEIGVARTIGELDGEGEIV